MTIKNEGPFRVREHHGFGHGLAPGTTSDINCLSCQREDAEPQVHPSALTREQVIDLAAQGKLPNQHLDGCTCDAIRGSHKPPRQWAN